MKIVYLADYPEFIPQIMGWFINKWSNLSSERTLKQWEKQVYKNRNVLPLTLIGIDDSDTQLLLLATATLRANVMDIHPEFKVWLSLVFVNPDYQGKGYGTEVITGAMTKAFELGTSHLYLYTRDNGKIYTNLGWKEVECTYFKGPVLIMSKELTPAEKK